MASLLPYVEVNPNNPPDSAVIWLHGLGASGHDFEPIVPALQLPCTLSTRFVFPHAPQIQVTINGGMIMPAWYDILEINIDRRVDVAQIEKSSAAIQALIDREVDNGIDSRRIVVAGFSQGGAVAYEAALSYPRALGGVMALSTYFATSNSVVLEPANANISMFISHGLQDDVVPESLGRQAMDTLSDKGYRPVYKTYPTAHNVHPQQIVDISNWLLSVLS